jgi:O-succinylbenzoic acid--CoA ligase
VRTVGNIAPWDPREYHKAAGNSQCTLSALVPTQLFDLVWEELVCPATLRAIVIGGQALSDGLYRRARALGWPVIPSYGMTEACSQVATASVTDISEGLPPIRVLPHVELKTERVPSEDASDPAQGESGIIRIRSKALLSGYLEAVNGEYVFRNPLEGGWFTTADLGIVDSGVLTVLGRVGDVVKIGGEHVQRSTLEDALSETLLALKESNDFCIDFAKDERLGFAVELFALDLKRGEQVSEHFNRLVHPAGRIRNVRVVSSIPRTGLGKVARTLLQTISSEEVHGKQKHDKQN